MEGGEKEAGQWEGNWDKGKRNYMARFYRAQLRGPITYVWHWLLLVFHFASTSWRLLCDKDSVTRRENVISDPFVIGHLLLQSCLVSCKFQLPPNLLQIPFKLLNISRLWANFITLLEFRMDD